jgi:hypothetical protein
MRKRKASRRTSAKNKAKKPRVEEEPDNEPPAWQKIEVENLDLDVSYVGKIDPHKRRAQPKRKRWTHNGDEPIINPQEVHRGWNMEEPDLDPECVKDC